MAETKDSGGLHRGTIVGAVVVVVAVALVVVLARGGARGGASQGDDRGEGSAAADRSRDNARDDGPGSFEEELRSRGPAQRSKTRRKSRPFVAGPEKMANRQSRWNPVRPSRLVVRYGVEGDGRSREDARRRIDDARRRFLEGADSWSLIREVSDPPRGIPHELAAQWADLSPREASPVFPIDDGFVVFFGAPDHPPEEAAAPPEEAAAPPEEE
jgi:hypothetical protein